MIWQLLEAAPFSSLRRCNLTFLHYDVDMTKKNRMTKTNLENRLLYHSCHAEDIFRYCLTVRSVNSTLDERPIIN